MEPGALGRRRRRGGAFSLARLFANGEAGAWYDPSDLTAEKVAWRRNLLTWSEDFTNARWSPLNVTVSGNTTLAPDNTTTADTVTETSATGSHYLSAGASSIDFTAATTYTLSVFAKNNGRRFLQLYWGGGASSVYTGNFDLQLGVVGTTSHPGAAGSSIASSISDAGNGWYRCVITLTTRSDQSGATSVVFSLSNSASASALPSYTGDGTSGAFLWGAQLERGSTATAYQRITNFTSDFLAAFPTHGLYQDSAGTTPVTALGQPVGLALDQSRGSAGTNGSRRLNLLTYSEQFDNAAWTKNSATVSANATTAPDGTTTADTITASSAGTYRTVRRVSAGLVANVTFVYSVAAKRNTSDWIFLRFYDSPAGDGAWFNVNTGTLGTVSGVTASITALGDGWHRCTISRVVGSTITFNEIDIGLSSSDNSFSAASGNSVFLWGADLRLASDATVAPTYQRVTDTWYNAQAGVHAIQPTSASRPLLDGRVNLLTFSEQFDNAAWSKTAASVSANTSVAPDGTTTADTFTQDTTTNTHIVWRSSGLTGAGAYTYSTYFKASTAQFVTLSITDGSSSGSNQIYATFDTANGTVTKTGGAGYSASSVTSVGNGWYRCSVTGTIVTPVNTAVYVWTFQNTTGTPTYGGYGGESFTGTGASVLIWGADLRLAADAAYPYQRVAAATDYADVGVPRAFAFDGFDDSFYTASNMDLSGTDKVTVLAGVRKLTTSTGFIAEISAAAESNNGAFRVATDSGGIEYFFTSRGTTAQDININNSAYNSPVTNVVALLADIAAPSMSARINSAIVGTNTNSQGTGTYGTYVMYMGRRNNASFPFNGKAYQLIVRGALTDDATLAQAERYVGAKTGIFL